MAEPHTPQRDPRLNVRDLGTPDPVIRVLGTVTALVEGEPVRLPPAQRRVLAILAAAGPSGLSADALADEIWLDDLPPSWNASIRNAIRGLRSALGPTAIETAGGRYRLSIAEGAVDLWQLLSLARRTERAPSGDELAQLLDGEPFPEIDGRAQIRRAQNRAATARHSLVERFVGSADGPRSPTALSAMRAYADRNPYDQRLVTLVRECLTAEGVDPGPTETQRRADPRSNISTTTITARTVPATIARNARSKLVGRDSEVKALVDSVQQGPGMLVLGSSGIGKSALIATVGQQLFEESHHVLHGIGNSERHAMAPFLNALPRFASELAEILGRADSRGAQNAAMLTALRQQVEAAHPDAPVCLILDDAHGFDSMSLNAIQHLWKVGPGASFRLIVAGQNVDSVETETLVQLAATSDVATMELAPLDRAALRTMAQLIHPDAFERALERLVGEVDAMSAGLPGVAKFMLRNADPQTLLLPSFDSSQAQIRVFDPYIQQLASPTVEVGAAAAVCGMSFSVNELTAVSGSTEDQVLSACEALMRTGFVAESDRPDEFAFIHLLLRNALIGAISDARRARLHKRLAARSTDVHEKARHLAAAESIVGPEAAAVALTRSAYRHIETLSWREAAAAFQKAIAAHPESVSFDDRVRFAGALDLSGADGTVVRTEAFNAAAKQGQWDRALNAACSGLPGAERISGDRDRLALLEQIPATALTSDEKRRRLETVLVRQRTFVGETKPRSLSGDSHEPLQTAVEAFVNQGVIGRLPDCYEPGTTFDDCQDPTLRARALQLQWLFDMERSSSPTSARVRRCLEEVTASCEDPVRGWHLRVSVTLDLRLRGEWNAADWLIEESLRHGDQHGVGDARIAEVAQRLFVPWVSGRLDTFDTGRFDNADDGASQLARALRTTVETVQQDAPTGSFETITRELCATESLYTVPLLTIMAEAIAGHASPETGRLVYERLEPRAGTCAVLANGVVHAGPVDCALAQLADDDRDRHLDAAIDTADHTGAVLWQVQTRLERAVDHSITSTERDRLLDEAANLATNTSLRKLVDAAEGRSGSRCISPPQPPSSSLF